MCAGRKVYGRFVREQERIKHKETRISGKRKKDEQILCTLPGICLFMITCAFFFCVLLKIEIR